MKSYEIFYTSGCINALFFVTETFLFLQFFSFHPLSCTSLVFSWDAKERALTLFLFFFLVFLFFIFVVPIIIVIMPCF